jgi:hypothetical protein
MLRKRLTGSKPKRAGQRSSAATNIVTYVPDVAKVYSYNLYTTEGQAEFFDNVIELLADESRWIKGALGTEDKYCIEGAITKVYRQTLQLRGEVPKPMLSGLLERALNIGHSLMQFNDRSTLSHDEMIAKLRAATLRIRRGEVALI